MPIDRNLEAHQKRDLKHFLRPWLQFRAYVVFLKPKKKMHFYGNEHQCTYQQCITGFVKEILLNREKGYTDLVWYIENSIRGKYKSAVIYRKDLVTGQFNLICRRYNAKGELEECQDPVITPGENKRLYFYTHKHQLVIQETDPATEDFKINL